MNPYLLAYLIGGFVCAWVYVIDRMQDIYLGRPVMKLTPTHIWAIVVLLVLWPATVITATVIATIDYRKVRP
jgi:hypothetical protein